MTTFSPQLRTILTRALQLKLSGLYPAVPLIKIATAGSSHFFSTSRKTSRKSRRKHKDHESLERIESSFLQDFSDLSRKSSRKHKDDESRDPIEIHILQALRDLNHTVTDFIMNRKRNAPAQGGPQKKQKMIPKVYAVKAGHKPGVYVSYAECQQQTSGFRGAIFKSFTSMEDAQAFVAGKKVAGEPDRFYAVAVGSPTGIFTDWGDASVAVTGVKGPKYRRFSTRSEAVAYIKQYGNREAIEALGETAEERSETARTEITQPEPIKSSAGLAAGTAKTAAGSDEEVLHIWTDGSSLMNGKKGARAGVGVFFGEHDSRNLSEPLRGLPQTNQRAELMAVKRALESVPMTQTVEIRTDSKYTIGCMNQWCYEWEKKGWKTAGSKDVKNLDILQPSLDLLKQRSRAGANTYFKWIKGHGVDRGNIAADQLAVRGAKMGM